VGSVEPTGCVENVYNLTVEGEHEYFANGLLVSNCDCLIYARQKAFHQCQVPREAPEVARTETEKANAWEAESKAKLLSKGQEQDFTSMLAAADWGGDGEW
jgi:hypothetical protein